MIKGVENKAQEESLRDWDMFRLEKRSQKGDIITLDNCIKGCYQEDRDQLFSLVNGDKTRTNGL